MICAPGKCIKCGVSIIQNGLEGPNYNEIELRLSPGEKTTIGICQACTLTNEDLPEVIKALNDYYAVTSAFRIEAKPEFLSIINRLNYGECVKRRFFLTQGGRCLGCHESLGENYIHLQNVGLLHERCNVSKETLDVGEGRND